MVTPLNGLHVKSKNRFKSEEIGRNSRAFTQWSPTDEPWEIMKYVAEYSKRQLSYPEDTLKAMQGIFNVLEKSKRPVYFLMGVPIMPPLATLERREPDHEYMIFSGNCVAAFISHNIQTF
jgi:hypothetical protein